MKRTQCYLGLSLAGATLVMGFSYGQLLDDRQPDGLRTLIGEKRPGLDFLSVASITLDMQQGEVSVELQNDSDQNVRPSRDDLALMCYRLLFRDSNHSQWIQVWQDPPNDRSFSPRPFDVDFDTIVAPGESETFTFGFPRWEMTPAARHSIVPVSHAIPYQAFVEVHCREENWDGESYSVLLFGVGYLTVE